MQNKFFDFGAILLVLAFVGGAMWFVNEQTDGQVEKDVKELSRAVDDKVVEPLKEKVEEKVSD